MEDVEALTPGRQYVFVLRDNSREHFPVAFGISERAHSFNVGDDSLTDWWPYFTDITDLPENWLETEEFAPLRELIQVTNDDVHTFDVVYGDDMKSIRRVADGRIVCDEGRLIGPEDAGQPVCVVSTDFLKTNGLKVGDTITLNLGNYLSEPYAPLGAVAVNRGRYSTEFKEQEFTVIGTWRDLNEGNHIVRDWFWCWSNNAIFVPSAFLPECVNADTYTPKPNDVSFVVGNAENIEAFQKKVLPQLEEMGLNCSFYDWGWSDVGPDLIQARNLARIKLLIFVGAAIMAMLLTVWLFIGRKKREFGILRALGMPRKEASAWLFIPFLCLGSLAALLGAAAAGWMNGRQLGQMVEVSEKAAPAGAAVYILGAIGFLLVLALLAWGDILLIRKKSILELVRADDGAPERRRRTAEASAAVPAPAAQWVPHDLGGSKSTHWRGRYLRRLLGRNPVRSSLSLLLAGLLVVAFGLLTVLRGIYAKLYKNVEVKPAITGGMTYERAEKIAESGYVRNPYYEFVCQSGEVEIRGDQVNVYLTNDLERLVSTPVDWLPGWDADTAMNVNEKVCVIWASWAAELGKGLGENLRIEEVGWFQKATNNGLYPLKPGETVEERRDASRPTVTIVGLIQGEELDTSVYLPAAGSRYFGCFMPGGKLDLAEYTLNDYHKAAEFTDYVKDVFSRIQDPLALSMDTSYADRIYKIHRLIEELYPLAVAAALLLGCVLPGLAVLHSSREISILRALGVRAKECVILYTLAQVLCALSGLVLGIAMVLVILRPELSAVIVPFTLYLAAHLAACALGSGVFAWMCARKHVLVQLQAKE
jgi:ABC-type antimicrobial peptide transport system permease subunit